MKQKEIITRDQAILILTEYATMHYGWGVYDNSFLEEQILLIWGKVVHIKRWYEFWLKNSIK